jgi:hypothetical protein
MAADEQPTKINAPQSAAPKCMTIKEISPVGPHRWVA